MNWFSEFIIVGGIIFWLLVAVTVLGVLINLHREKPGWALFFIVASAVVMTLFGDFKPLIWVVENPMLFALGFLAYFLLSIIWAFIKWYMFSVAAKESYQNFRDSFISRLGRPFDVVQDKHKLASEFSRYYQHHHRYGETVPPAPADNAGRIVMWMILWPVDLVWSIINDPVVRLLYWTVDRIGGALGGISKNRFKKFEEFN